MGAIWYFNSSDDEAPPRSLKIVPHIGNDSLIQFKSSDRQSVRVVTRAIEESLECEFDLGSSAKVLCSKEFFSLQCDQ